MKDILMMVGTFVLIIVGIFCSTSLSYGVQKAAIKAAIQEIQTEEINDQIVHGKHK